jgi:Na+/proline symporter
MNFSFIDWIILVVYLSLTLGVGFWVKRYVENLSGY